MKSLFSLKKYFVKYKSKLLLGFLFILFSNAATVYVPILLKESIDILYENPEIYTILRYSFLIVITALIGGIFRFYIRQTIIVVSREIEFDLRQEFWTYIQLLPMRYFQNTSTGDIMAHATNDINAVRMFIGPAVMYSIDTLIRFAIVIVIMFSISTPLTLFSLLPLPLLSFLVYKLGKKIHVRFTKIQEQFSRLTSKAQESFSGIRVIKSYVREENEIKEFTDLSQIYLDRNMAMIRIQAFFMPILFLITGISIIVVIWYGGIQVIEKILTLGEISAFVVYLGLLIWPVIAFGWVINIIQQASASMKRINGIMSQPYEIENSSATDFSIKSIRGHIEFRNVSFRYKNELPYVLKNINLEIPTGKTVAIIGHTGVGKTSLINLIPRLYDISEGEILIDGINIKKIPLDILRSNIGMVPQETFLFSDTLANNIAYGRESTGMDLIREVSSIARLDKDVESFPLKYETVLGERGITLSGGQKQRSCLARALAINPKILILDDSFSAVDTNTEEEILVRLRGYMKERTSIIISHRISTVKDADSIIVLHDGTIAEKGTHEELVGLGGIYADINYKQTLEKELEEIN